MHITHDTQGNRYVAVIKQSEKALLARNGWTWDRKISRMWTEDAVQVEPFLEACDDECHDHLIDIFEEMDTVIDQSRALDTDFVGLVPEGKALFGFQNAGVEFALARKDTLIADDPGLGKCSPLYCNVLLSDGSWKSIGNVKEGDVLAAVDGTSTKVTGVYPQGVKPAYKVMFRDGTSTECCDEHLWAVRDGNMRSRGRPFSVRPLHELVDRGLKKQGKNKWDIPLAAPLILPEKIFIVEPYILGLLLGDGALGGSGTVLTCHLDEADEISANFNINEFTLIPKAGDCVRLYLKGYASKIKELGLNVIGGKKFIPREYFQGSIEQRLALLQGLMDSDGSAKNNRITFHNVNRTLSYEVAELVRSLGGVASVREYNRTDKETYDVEYQVNVKLSAFCPFRLKRKVEHWWPANQNNCEKKFIESVEYVHDTEQVCIRVDHPSHLYITDDYIVTHNTNQAISIANHLHAQGELNEAAIVCEASQKAHWPRLWNQWTTTGLSIGVVSRRPRVKNKVRFTETIIPETDVIVVNYDILEHVNKFLRDGVWDLLIADEVQALQNEDSARTRQVFGGESKLVDRQRKGKLVRVRLDYVSAIPAKRRVFLTGTPFENRPHDMWPIIHAFDPDGIGKDHDEFARRFCGAYVGAYGLDTRGATNLWEFQKRIRSTFMVRRTTKQALPDMPPKSRRPIFIPSDDFEHILTREEGTFNESLAALESFLQMDRRGDGDQQDAVERTFSVWDELQHRFGEEIFGMSYEEILDEVPDVCAVAMQEISKMRSELAVAKVPHVIKHIRQLNEAGEPCVVFFYHTAMGQALKAEWSNSCAYIDGSVPAMKRQDEVDRFMNDEGCTNIIGQITAMGKGFTMTRARHVVFGELDWRRGAMTQAENRVWRIPQNERCMIDHMIIEGSIEVRQSQSLIEKQEVADAALDDEPDQ